MEITIKDLSKHYGKALTTLKKPMQSVLNQTPEMKSIRAKPIAPPAISVNLGPPRIR